MADKKSSLDSPAQIVARFLRANHYNQTLDAFIEEAGLPEDAGSLEPGSWTIEQILQEKLHFDTSLQFEKKGPKESSGWTSVAPKTCHEPRVGVGSNVLCVSHDTTSQLVSVACADRSWKQITTTVPYEGEPALTQSNDSPILSMSFKPAGFVLSTAMSGHLSLRKSSSLALVDECRHHSKYAVQVASYHHDNDWFVATAGWDQKVNIYALDVQKLASIEDGVGPGDKPLLPEFLGDPIHAITLISNPESLVFVRHPDTQIVHLVLSRRDSTFLYYFRIVRDSSGDVSVSEAGRQNLAPHSNAWVAFTPCSLATSPIDPTLIAVATSHLPHMKVIIARLLFPGPKTDYSSIPSEQQTQANVARAELALQDREDAAIRIHVTTMAPQTPYSTPQAVWRPDGTGLFVNGDDGVIRGVEATTGKVVSLLKGHEAGSKVRTLWAGLVHFKDNDEPQEILISGGFDKKLLIWTTESNP